MAKLIVEGSPDTPATKSGSSGGEPGVPGYGTRSGAHDFEPTLLLTQRDPIRGTERGDHRRDPHRRRAQSSVSLSRRRADPTVHPPGRTLLPG